MLARAGRPERPGHRPPWSAPSSPGAARTCSSACPSGLMDQAASALCTRATRSSSTAATRTGTCRWTWPRRAGGSGHGHPRPSCARRRPVRAPAGSARTAARLLGVDALRDVDRSGCRARPARRRRDARRCSTWSPRTSGCCSRRPCCAPVGHRAWRPAGRSHPSLRDDFEISCPRSTSRWRRPGGNGALGARMTGGGFGGCIIALVGRGEADRVAQAVGGELRPGRVRRAEPLPRCPISWGSADLRVELDPTRRLWFPTGSSAGSRTLPTNTSVDRGCSTQTRMATLTAAITTATSVVGLARKLHAMGSRISWVTTRRSATPASAAEDPAGYQDQEHAVAAEQDGRAHAQERPAQPDLRCPRPS